MDRRILHVVPNKEEKTWEVRGTKSPTDKGPGDTVYVPAKTQAEAIRFAQEIIAAQIVVHGKDGKISREYTYGLDPTKTKG